jgi:tellurite methyltransferase
MLARRYEQGPSFPCVSPAAGNPRLWHVHVEDQPSSLLLRFASLLPAAGVALDLACGKGRNSIFLAQRGLRTVGVDRSLEALRAAQARQAATARAPSDWTASDWVCADLERFLPVDHTFDIVLCFYYRDPALYSVIRRTIRPGGLLFYETFTRDQLQFGRGPRNPAHVLERGELLRIFGDWKVLVYQERSTEPAIASLIARKIPLAPVV